MNKFEEYVKSLFPRGVVMLMIESLENPVTKIDMDTFGVVKGDKRRVCYGCAATNTMLRAAELSGLGKASKLKFNIGGSWDEQAAANGIDKRFLIDFESTINYLRMGDIKSYNLFAKRIGMVQLKPWPTPLPCLTTRNYKHNLKWYREYAMEQSNVKN